MARTTAADLGLDLLAHHVELDGVGRAGVDAGVALGAHAAVEAAGGAEERLVLGHRALGLAEVARRGAHDGAGLERLAAVVDVLPAEHVGLVDDRQRLVEGGRVELGALQVAVDHEGGAAALADGRGDHRRAGDDVAGGEDVRHGGLQRAGVGLERAVAVGLEPERLGVGAHAGGDDDHVALEALVLALVVLGVEAAVGVEHAGADLELGAAARGPRR